MADALIRSRIIASASVILGMVLLVSGCAASVASTTPALGPSSSPERTSTVTASAAPSAAAVASAGPTEGPIPSATATLKVGSVAVSQVDGLRVRSKPRVADDSDKLEPVLPRGSLLYVLDGPVSASGYTWYEVAPLGSRTLPHGWVADQSRTGESWLGRGRFDCPPVPDDVRSLAALPPAVGPACFPRVPITVSARVISCQCDIDGAWLTPGWFSLGTGHGEMLVPPTMTRPPTDIRDWFWLSLDPAGDHPKALPMGEVVEVTGIFDHPSAADCTITEMDSNAVPSQSCRLIFAVERLAVRP